MWFWFYPDNKFNIKSNQFAWTWKAAALKGCRCALTVLGFILLGLFSASTHSSRLYAQPNYETVINREHDIKAAYLYNFCKYVEWPQGPSQVEGKITVAILGESPIHTSLEKIAARKTIQNKKLHIQEWKSPQDFEFCHVLFVPKSHDPALLKAFLQKEKHHSVLLVGEQINFTQKEGIINFFTDNNKIRFEINENAALRRQLKISSKLMQLAKKAD